ncbi:uncharacterized protein METZ01_LOCUS146554 [marine metagenome]|uniref:Uncharacterized protein n=1 Tax=marine metagenome TaxID=408172 RepID=A0A381ZWT2_9ZZZZ
MGIGKKLILIIFFNRNLLHKLSYR